MKIALYSRPENPSLPVIVSELETRSADFTLNPASAEGYDVVLSFGGDGTFLSTVRQTAPNTVPILGINSGRLGFMATVAMEEIPLALDQLWDNLYSVEERTLLQVEGAVTGLAFNEFTIQRSSTSMISIEIVIDGEPLSQYWADGVIVSTATGSTAYSLSVGGAVLAPECRCLILSAIAPHNLNIRPLVVPDSSHISLKVTTREASGATATIDNREYDVQEGAYFELTRSPHKVRVIRPQGHSFYKTLRHKLFWGKDVRNKD